MEHLLTFLLSPFDIGLLRYSLRFDFCRQHCSRLWHYSVENKNQKSVKSYYNTQRCTIGSFTQSPTDCFSRDLLLIRSLT